MSSFRVPLEESEPGCPGPCNPVDRRAFLFASGATMMSVTLPGLGWAQGQLAKYPRQKVAELGKVKTGEAVEFRYPWDHSNCRMVLVKLGQEGGGGVGPKKDIVAFSSLCPHMGWEIPSKKFYPEVGMAGPCPGHLTTFDLTRHGMVVSGHATQGLPQVVLEVEGENILAVGIFGLLFGFGDNKAKPG
ncbi:MAG: arsenate reductase (azurin) small subunit [Gemmataceae bacterium]|nr:arsenate reductase (azurin) small subunit [Gemmataceae bacterium]